MDSTHPAPLFKARSGESVALKLHNPTPHPFAFHLEAHSARLLDTLDDGWKPWWHDSLYIPPRDTVRIVFRAEKAGEYRLEAQQMDGEALQTPQHQTFVVKPH